MELSASIECVTMQEHLKGQSDVYSPELVAAMSKAFDDACSLLNVRGFDTASRSKIARRIIELAQSGITDAETLRQKTVGEFHS
jgi:hypothetical protein